MPDRTKKKPTPAFHRKVHIAEKEIWSYDVGKERVRIRPPDCKATYHVMLSKLLGLSWDAIEDARWDHSDEANVTPAIVRDYIMENLCENIQKQ